MKKNTRKLKKAALLLCSAVLLVCISIGATVAYLTSTATVTNTFTVGNVAITMDETKVDENGTPIQGANRVQANTYKLMPGHTYTKDPTVHVGTTSEDAYLGVKVVFENSKNADANLKLNMLSIFTGVDENAWDIEKRHDSNNDVYYLLTYKNVISKGNNIQLFNKVMIPDEMTNEQIADLNNIKMVITAYAVQKDGFDTPSEALTTAFATEFA